MTNRSLTVAAVVLLAGCYPKSALPPTALSPTQLATAQKHSPDVTEEVLERGRVTFVSKCGECHDHADLTAIRLSKWPGILVEMSEKADLDAAAKADLSAFILSAAEAAGARP